MKVERLPEDRDSFCNDCRKFVPATYRIASLLGSIELCEKHLKEAIVKMTAALKEKGKKK